MKSILIQQSNNKFLQNCSLVSFDDISIIDIDIKNNLYQTFFRHKPYSCLFSANMISQEIIQFCEDYHAQTNIYFFVSDNATYHNLKNRLSVDSIKYIGYNNLTDLSIPDNLINSQIFYHSDVLKQPAVVCFMDGLDTIPQDLMDILYPSTKIPIKLFNCPSIKHYQNLGFLNEKDKAEVLQNSTYYLDMGQPIEYSYHKESIACGCITISIEDIKNDSYLSKIYKPMDIPLISYNHFLKDTLQL